MKVKVRFLLHKTFGLEKDSYVFDNVDEDITIIEFIKRLSKELESEVMQKIIVESGGRGLLVLVNSVAINDLNKTFRSLRSLLKGSKEFEITIAPLLEGG